MSNATLSADSAPRESLNLFAMAAGLVTRFRSALRCANAVESGRNPAMDDLARLGIHEPLIVARHGRPL
jgi:hypothetical protein